MTIELRTSRRIGASLAIIAILSALLSACTLPSQRKIDCSFGGDKPAGMDAVASDVVIVMSPAESFVDFENVFNAADPVIREAIGVEGAQVSVVLADGRPRNIRTIPAKKGDSETATEAINKHLIEKLTEVYTCIAKAGSESVENSVSLEPEVDLLAALNVAAGTFNRTSTPDQRHIIVLSNGLQTTGQYSFSDQGSPSESDVGRIVGALDKQGGLPDITGATVDFVGLGLVNVNEPVLNQQTLDGITAFWAAVVGASGGRMGDILAQVVDGMPAPGSIPVADVMSLKDACISVAVTEDDGVSFAPGTADFLDSSAASAEAAKIADRISKSTCPGDITVTGFVASATQQDEYVFGNPEDAALSQARAEAFKGLLIAAGVSTNINAVGAGKGPVNDWDESGRYVEDLGAQNRKIVISQ